MPTPKTIRRALIIEGEALVCGSAAGRGPRLAIGVGIAFAPASALVLTALATVGCGGAAALEADLPTLLRNDIFEWLVL